MLTSEIPETLDIRCAPFTGIYKRRKMQSKDLYCWFNVEDDKLFPHVSVHINIEHNVWRHFHVTYPLEKIGAWEDKPTAFSFSIHYEIDGGTIRQTSVTDTAHVNRTDGGGMGYREMQDESKLFALRFVQKAMVQSALA
jgi:hypothetical protein